MTIFILGDAAVAGLPADAAIGACHVAHRSTGGAAAVSGIRVTGKTGTAENSSGAEHGWFMGTAQVQGRNVAFAVIVENCGSGAVAAAIARRLILALNGR